MKEFHLTTLMEASIIVVAAIILSFAFTGVTGKGLFRGAPESKVPATPGHAESTFLTYEEAQRLYVRERPLFIDARPACDFIVGHIKGAVSVPLHEFDKNHPILADVPKDRMLVLYCDGEECNSSVELARMLHESGYMNVKVFFGGWNEWRAHKQPTEP